MLLRFQPALQCKVHHCSWFCYCAIEQQGVHFRGAIYGDTLWSPLGGWELRISR